MVYGRAAARDRERPPAFSVPSPDVATKNPCHSPSLRPSGKVRNIPESHRAARSTQQGTTMTFIRANKLKWALVAGVLLVCVSARPARASDEDLYHQTLKSTGWILTPGA